MNRSGGKVAKEAVHNKREVVDLGFGPDFTVAGCRIPAYNDLLFIDTLMQGDYIIHGADLDEDFFFALCMLDSETICDLNSPAVYSAEKRTCKQHSRQIRVNAASR
jgi:hypothetical protein